MIDPEIDQALRTRGLRLTDESARAYQLAVTVGETLHQHHGADRTMIPAVVRIIETVAEYEHGSADWPADWPAEGPDAYCATATDLCLCILLA